MTHFLAPLLIFFSVAGLWLPGTAIGANALPGKWAAMPSLPVSCGQPPAVTGFGTCREAADEIVRIFEASGCLPGYRRITDYSACGTDSPGHIDVEYEHPNGHLWGTWSAGRAKSYCDDYGNPFHPNLLAGISPTLGIFCPSATYSIGRNTGMPDYCPNCLRGNPVNPANGNKFQIEPDYAAQGPFPLQFTRYYNSLLSSDGTGRVGSNWTHTYRRKLVFNVYMASPVIVGALREDGKEIPFNLVGGAYVADANFVEKLVRTGGTWQLTNARDEIELYDGGGKLTSITNRAGLTHTVAYDATGQLASVTDSFGRGLTFTYLGGRIQTMTVPGGLVYQYAYSTDGFNNLLRVTYPDTFTRTYHYENSSFRSHLTGITDENGQRFSTYTYVFAEGFGLLTVSERAGGAGKVTASYIESFSNAIRNVSVTDFVTPSLTATRTYTFQSAHGSARNTGISGPVCPECGPATRTYSAQGNVVTANDWNGFRTHYKSYDTARNLEVARDEGLTSGGGVIAGVTRTISTQWDANYRLPTGIAEPLRITTMSYGGPSDPNTGNRGSLLTKTIQASTDGTGAAGFGATATGTPRTWTYTYNANGSVLTVDGPRTDVPDVTTYTYYANNATCPGANALGCRGQVETITNAAGHVTQITEYNAHGQPLSIMDPNGLVTTLAYDARQRVTSRSVGGETTTYTYDNAGQLTKVTLPDGSFLDYTYDNAHRLTGISDNLGNRISYTLDLAGNRTQEQVFDPAKALAQTRSRVYNNLNRLTQEIGATGQTTAFGYDNQGNVTSIDGPLAGTVDVTTNTYDALNRLTRVTDPNSGQVNYGYDGLDQLTSVSDPRSLTTTYGYDGLANLNQQVSPDTGTTSNTYDAAGNLLTQTDAKGQVTSYAYDALNRVTSITYHGGVTHTYAYDQGANGKGRLTQVVEPNSTTNYVYDQKGRLTTETRIINAVSYVTAYAYDGSGRMTGITYPSGRTVTYTLDSLGRIQQVATTKDGVTQPVVSSVAYRPFGPAQSFSFGNGQTYSRGFDQDGRIASYTLAVQTIAVGYDPAGRISFLSDAGNPTNTNNYGYDNLDRLTSFTGPSFNQAFTYDGVGNRLTKTVGASTDTYAYGSTSNRLSTITGTNNRTYAYDNNGSTTGDSVNTYAYDTRGRMTQAVSSVGTTDYKVNSLGQRIRKTSSQGDTVYHYDAQGKLIAESNASGAVQKEYIYLGDTPVAVLQ